MNLKSVALLSVLICGASAQTLSVFTPVGIVPPGTTATIKIMFANAVGSIVPAPAALQFEILGTSETGPISVLLGPAARQSGKAINCNTAVPVRCILWGMQDWPIVNGEIADAIVPILTTAIQSTETINLQNMFAASPDGVSLPITTAGPGTIIISSKCDFNGDSKLDTSDVLLVVSQALGAGAPCSFGDLNKDGKCDIFDVFREVLAVMPANSSITGSGICKIGP